MACLFKIMDKCEDEWIFFQWIKMLMNFQASKQLFDAIWSTHDENGAFSVEI
jgi:nitrate/TMAO reductase-like tetraheme cytochrome c subunit